MHKIKFGGLKALIINSSVPCIRKNLKLECKHISNKRSKHPKGTTKAQPMYKVQSIKDKEMKYYAATLYDKEEEDACCGTILKLNDIPQMFP